jgi:beta-glucosidase
LKDFSKIALEPGQEATVRFALDRRAFSYYDPEVGDWVLEPGEFRILVGSSSRDIRQEGTVTVVVPQGTKA